MRQCPHCGHIEPSIWRNKRHRLFTQYCTLDELKDWEPELWAALVASRPAKQIRIGYYIYHITKANYVDKIHYLDSRDGVSYREPDQEKRFKFQHPNQRKLAPLLTVGGKGIEQT